MGNVGHILIDTFPFFDLLVLLRCAPKRWFQFHRVGVYNILRCWQVNILNIANLNLLTS